jgi:hypothetical protein
VKHIQLLGGVLVLLYAPLSMAAVVGVREAAVSLERQLLATGNDSVSQSFELPLANTTVVLDGQATLERIEDQSCRRVLELTHDQPFERRGLRITNISRRSVQEGPCRRFADAMVAQATLSANNIAEQIGVSTAGVDAAPGQRMLVADTSAKGAEQNVAAAHLQRASSQGAPVTLTVLTKAVIRDAPTLKNSEKLSRADVGTRLKARRIVDNPDWFVLDGGLRFISASVVDVTETGSMQAPARGDSSRIKLRVLERAVVRNKPSFRGDKVASLAAGVERLARKVPGMAGWFELEDSDNPYPLYIHESVVSENKLGKRL